MTEESKKVILLSLLAIPGAVALLIGLSALFAVPVYFLWNALVPSMFKFAEGSGFLQYPPFHISYLQAWGLNLLAGFMFGGRISKK